MATGTREAEPRGGGVRLRTRFTLMMSCSLALVMAVAGYFLWRTSTRLATGMQADTLIAAAKLTAEATKVQTDLDRVRAELAGLQAVERSLAKGDKDSVLNEVRDRISALERAQRQYGAAALEFSSEPDWEVVDGAQSGPEESKVLRAPVTFGGATGILYRVQKGDQRPFNLLVPPSGPPPDQALRGLIIGIVILVILVGAVVSLLVAGQVSGPLEHIVEDIRHISTGDLQHKSRARGSRELQMLAGSIDRMTKGLAEARETELALSIRDRELEVASEVREALLPKTTPQLAGFGIGEAHITSAELWGDFHDFLEVRFEQDPRVGLLVCDVSGKGLPGALVGATARSYLRSALCASADVKSALISVNRDLARDVKRGMYVSALYVLVEPRTQRATVACAGHKIPLVRFSASDGKVRLIQPEGIALAFDKGPVFERRLEVAQVPIEPGDRLVLVNSGAVEVRNPEGRELGEKPLYAQIMKHGALPTEEFLERMRSALEAFAAGSELPRDISIVTVARRA